VKTFSINTKQNLTQWLC